MTIEGNPIMTANSPWFSGAYLILAVLLLVRVYRVMRRMDLLTILHLYEEHSGVFPRSVREVPTSHRLVAFLALFAGLASLVLYGLMLAFHRNAPAPAGMGPLLTLAIHVRNAFFWAVTFAAVESINKRHKQSAEVAEKTSDAYRSLLKGGGGNGLVLPADRVQQPRLHRAIGL